MQHHRNITIRTLLIALLIGLMAAGTATARSPLKLRFDDSGMNYAAVDSDDFAVNVSDKSMRDTAHLALGYQDNALIVALSSRPRPDHLLTLTIADLPHYRSFGADPSAAALKNVRDSRYTSNKVANIGDVEEIRFIRYATTVNDLRIMHHGHSLKALVALYDGALQNLGFSRVDGSSWRNGGDYVYQNGEGLVKLSFHREGDGVALRMHTL